jgi:hypothetical protein
LGCLGTATMREIEDGRLVTERNIWIADHGHLGFGRVVATAVPALAQGIAGSWPQGGQGIVGSWPQGGQGIAGSWPQSGQSTLPATLRPIIIDTAIGRISQSTMAWETLRASGRSRSAKAERTGACSCGVGAVQDERAHAFNREIAL